MKVLVTGGAGFIGSHLVDRLLAGGHAVRVLDNFATGRHENIAHVMDDIELIEGDIRSFSTVERAADGVEVVLHEAALPSVARSIEDPAVTTEVNLGGTVNLLMAARKSGVRRVVFASSSSVYGDSPSLPKHEGLSPSPKSPYAVSKLACEYELRVFSALHGLETIALRYFNVFGPRQDPGSQYSGVISVFCCAALAGKPFPVHGDGSQTRDFTFVDNVVHANLLAAESTVRLDGAIANIACGTRVSLREMTEVLNELAGTQLPMIQGPARSGDVAHSQADITQAGELLGYRPVTSFRDGLRRTLDWYACSLAHE